MMQRAMPPLLAPRSRRLAPGLLLAVLSSLLAACASPAPPAWQTDAATASERFVEAALVGDARTERLEFARARERTARTGRVDLVARIELLRCAVRLASLSQAPCTGFEKLRGDLAPGPETAYADYLEGRLPADASTRIALLPNAQQAIAALPPGPGGKENAAGLLVRIDDPLSRLVAAALLTESGRGSDAVTRLAVETASGQGWRRALLAWLALQLEQAAHDPQRAAAVRRRLELMVPPEADDTVR